MNKKSGGGWVLFEKAAQGRGTGLLDSIEQVALGKGPARHRQFAWLQPTQTAFNCSFGHPLTTCLCLCMWLCPLLRAVQVGELLDGRYEVFACKGKGVFSTVLRARDKLRLLPNPLTGAEEFAEVAIKVRITTRIDVHVHVLYSGTGHATSAAMDPSGHPQHNKPCQKLIALPPYFSSSSLTFCSVVHGH